jgi:hypothetical protein
MHEGRTRTRRVRDWHTVPTHVCPSIHHFIRSRPQLDATRRCTQLYMAFKALSKSEKAYIQTSLQAQSPLRGDGRSLHEFRSVTIQTRAVPIANGSAHLNLGRASDENIGGTEVLAAAKLEVEDITASTSAPAPLDSSGNANGVEGGRIVCSVSWCVTLILSKKKKK